MNIKLFEDFDDEKNENNERIEIKLNHISDISYEIRERYYDLENIKHILINNLEELLMFNKIADNEELSSHIDKLLNDLSNNMYDLYYIFDDIEDLIEIITQDL